MRQRNQDKLPVRVASAMFLAGIVLAVWLWVRPVREVEVPATSGVEAERKSGGAAVDASLRLSYITPEEIKAKKLLDAISSEGSEAGERLKAIREADTLDPLYLEAILLAAVQDANPEVRIEAVELLARMPDTFAQPLLRVLLHDMDAEVRSYAIEVLAGLPEVFLLKSYDPREQEVPFEPDVAEAALDTLLGIDSKVAFEAAMELLLSPHEEIVEITTDELEAYTDVRFSSYDSALQWWHGNKLWMQPADYQMLRGLVDGIFSAESEAEQQSKLAVLQELTQQEFATAEEAIVWVEGNQSQYDATMFFTGIDLYEASTQSNLEPPDELGE